LYCPLANFNIACFSFSGSTVLPPTAQLFQKVSRSIDIASVKDFANSIDAFLAWQSFLFGNQLSYFKDHVYLKSNYWNEIREMSFLKKKKFFWNSLICSKANTRHSIHVVLWLSCILKTEIDPSKD
jgi:hypothetical protein